MGIVTDAEHALHFFAILPILGAITMPVYSLLQGTQLVYSFDIAFILNISLTWIVYVVWGGLALKWYGAGIPLHVSAARNHILLSLASLVAAAVMIGIFLISGSDVALGSGTYSYPNGVIVGLVVTAAQASMTYIGTKIEDLFTEDSST